jgi:hypothetical protein
MGFWNKAQRFVAELCGDPLNNPVIPLWAAGFLTWLMGGEPTAAGEAINETTALQQIAGEPKRNIIVFSCA